MTAPRALFLANRLPVRRHVQTMDIGTDVLLGGVGAVVLLALYALYLRSRAARWKRRSRALEESVGEERRDAVERSRAVLKGQVGEQFAPMLGGFPYHPSDARFVGSPIDYVVFDGYTAVKDGDGGDLRVVLLDVKTGGARLSREQRRIRRAVERGDVEWRTVEL